jgi:hypothetical protein
MTIKLGTPVRQIQPAPIQGVVVGKTFNEAGDHFQFLVEYTDADGAVHSRSFDEGQIEAAFADTDPATPGAAA